METEAIGEEAEAVDKIAASTSLMYRPSFDLMQRMRSAQINFITQSK